MNTLRHPGDYATVAPMETFTASQTDRHPTDLAMLRGARLVTAQETEEGRRWAESRIKALDRRRPDYGTVHAPGLLHVHSCVQVVYRRQS